MEDCSFCIYHERSIVINLEIWGRRIETDRWRRKQLSILRRWYEWYWIVLPHNQSLHSTSYSMSESHTVLFRLWNRLCSIHLLYDRVFHLWIGHFYRESYKHHLHFFSLVQKKNILFYINNNSDNDLNQFTQTYKQYFSYIFLQQLYSSSENQQPSPPHLYQYLNTVLKNFKTKQESQSIIINGQSFNNNKYKILGNILEYYCDVYLLLFNMIVD